MQSSEDDRSLTQVLLAGGLWNQLTSVIPLVVSLVMTPYVIHGFGIARWGLFLLVTTIVNFLGPLNGGLGGAAGRYFALYAGRDDRRKTTETLLTLSLMLLLLGSVAMLAGWFLAPLVIKLFSVPAALRAEGTFLLRALSAIISVSFLHNLFSAVINARQRYALTNITYTATYAVWSSGLVACVHFHLGLRGVAFVFLTQQAVGTLVIVPSAMRYLSRDGLHLLSLVEMREIGRYALSVQGMTLIGLVNNEVDSLLIGGLFSVRTLAFYNSGSGFALNLRELLLNLMQPITTHLAQVFGREGDDATENEFRRLQRLWVVGSTGWSAVGMGASYFAVVAWLGPEFKLAGEVALLCTSTSMIYSWTNALSAYLAAVGRPDLELRFTLTSMVVNVVLTVPFAIVGGALGVAAATGVATVLTSLYLMRIVHRRYRSTVPGFLHEVPIVPGLVALGVTVGFEMMIRGAVPDGVVGLLACGVPALIGLLAFVVMVLGRQTLAVVKALRRPRTAKDPLLAAVLSGRDKPKRDVLRQEA